MAEEPIPTPTAPASAASPASASEPPRLDIASSPHVRSPESVPRIMWTVLACLLPATVWAVYLWGLAAATVIATCTGGAVVFEAIAQRIAGKPLSVSDGSAALTGLLLAFTLPPGVSVFVCLVGAFVAVVVAKAVFGGLGHNPFNPALTARVFLLVAFPGPMTRWPLPVQDVAGHPRTAFGQSVTWWDGAGRTLEHATAQGEAALQALAVQVDAITAATPLAVLKEHWQKGTEPLARYADYAVGTMPGSLGEVSAVLLLLGAAVLLLRGIITWHIPVAFLLGVVVFSGLTHLVNPSRYLGPGFHVLTGGVILGAFFMATDYVSSPTYPWGKLVFGLGCGGLTMLIRLWGGFPEGVAFSILLMNSVTPLIDRFTRPRKFGAKPWAEPEVQP
jgi:Na+-translocating ferredoxin:NAD+ oxidoreductase subunit D